ncbi:M48 family metallopeptidase [Leptothoe kymatousa]|uniref:M48 family metallopeptidase n=1 Tax=Leptothoe kymatousa TAU-MAC 1615 TaxID=2364775 RepID=A0ABS5Y561_9CYAN|nr:SprT family zinc-dependent metalloprotease [Leptothoe kymatousa]MBT9312963.1 M48 family metallopeptidase [Leptothoe kymatousa TAU-MAC 1615]
MAQLELFPPSEPPSSEHIDYTVRKSKRAKHVSIKITVDGNVEVVVPPTYNCNKIPTLIKKRRGWILKNRERLSKERQDTVTDWQMRQPEKLELRWLADLEQTDAHEVWHISYEASPGPTLCIPMPGNQLKIRGQVESFAICNQVLCEWLGHKAHKELVPWIRQLSFDLDLPFKRPSVRGQKTRWASCSSSKNISLNYKLLFLPKEVVQYVLVHELCHTVHMNHSQSFWQLVSEKMPGFEPYRKILKNGWKYVPRWVES